MSDVPASRAAIRPLTSGDLPALVRIERALFGASAWSRAMLAEELHGPARWYVGAELPGADGLPGAGGPGDGAAAPKHLVGYAGLWFDGDDAQVMTIGVAPPQQGAGIGAALLAALLGRARELGAHSMLLEVRIDNEPALALYERFGFVRMGRRRGYYQPENVDAWTMRRGLGDPEP